MSHIILLGTCKKINSNPPGKIVKKYEKCVINLIKKRLKKQKRLEC